MNIIAAGDGAGKVQEAAAAARAAGCRAAMGVPPPAVPIS